MTEQPSIANFSGSGMNANHLALYQRLKDFCLDRADSARPLSKRLARENGWSRDYANRVIQEYKRFAFLAIAADHPVSPSDQIDQVWHLHLTYTRSYWEDFCPNVLQTSLHHEPTRGGPSEGHKFNELYRKTLESYERFFGEVPPADIWSTPEVRFSHDLKFERVNTEDHWILPKLKIQAIALWSVLAIALVSCGSVPAKLSTQNLAETYATALFWGGLAAAIAGWISRKFDPNLKIGISAFGFFAFSLFVIGIVPLTAGLSTLAAPEFLSLYGVGMLSTFLLGWAANKREPFSRVEAPQSSDPQPQFWAEFNRSTSVQITVGDILWLLARSSVVFLFGLGIIRICIGLSRQHPVGYLALMALVLAIYFWFLIRPLSSQEGAIPKVFAGIFYVGFLPSIVLLAFVGLLNLQLLVSKYGVGSVVWVAFLGFVLIISFLSNRSQNRRSESYNSNRRSGGYDAGGYVNGSCGDGGGSDGGGGDCGGGDGGCGGGGCGG